MIKRETLTTAPARAVFYLVKPSTAEHLGRVPIATDKDGNQKVLMTAAEAKWWVDQGVLSPNHPTVQAEKVAARKQSAAEADQEAEAARQSASAEDVDESESVLQNQPERRHSRPGRRGR